MSNKLNEMQLKKINEYHRTVSNYLISSKKSKCEVCGILLTISELCDLLAELEYALNYKMLRNKKLVINVQKALNAIIK